VLATCAIDLLCALLLHLSQAGAPKGLHDLAHRARAIRSTISTGFFVLALFGFFLLAFARADVLPFMHL
jgi:hypothetical protein